MAFDADNVIVAPYGHVFVAPVGTAFPSDVDSVPGSVGHERLVDLVADAIERRQHHGQEEIGRASCRERVSSVV